jgi:nucleoside-diphosphate-sugar epimerase
MRAYVTGGSGFIGRHVVKKLRDRDYEVVALARSVESAALLRELGAEVAFGDITDMGSLRESMSGADVVFHLAAQVKIGNANREQMEVVNVGGTRKVLRVAQELGIPRIVYTSTVGVFGDTGGKLVDESYFQEGPFLSEYDRTKWLAHYKVAQPLLEKGAPIIIVMPGVAYGPGDNSLIGEMMRLFYRGFPVVPGPETVVTYAHVEDIAEGHILAAEKGKIEETYILTGPAIPFGEMMDFWAQLTGKPAPRVRVPASLVRASRPVTNVAGKFTDLNAAFSSESAAIAGATYMASSDKARTELGWQTRALQTGMLETFDWIATTENLREIKQMRRREETIARLALITAVLLLIAWLIDRGRRKKSAEDR